MYSASNCSSGAARFHSEARQRAWTSWFWVCRRCPCPQDVRFPPLLRVIIVLHILDTALLAALHELREGGLPPTATLTKFLGLRHCQVPCAKNVKTRVEVDFLRKFVSLLLTPQMFLDRRFSTHCWDKRGPNETHVSHKKNSFDGKSTIQKQVESRVQNRSGCTAQIVARSRAHLSNGHMMQYLWQDTHTDASTRNKQENQCQTTGRLESSATFRHNGKHSFVRLHKKK